MVALHRQDARPTRFTGLHHPAVLALADQVHVDQCGHASHQLEPALPAAGRATFSHQRPIVIPHRSSVIAEPAVAPPGNYTVRLTVGGKTYTQPLAVRLDPRVTTSAAALTQSEKLSVEMYQLARSTLMAYGQARNLFQEVDKLESTEPATDQGPRTGDANTPCLERQRRHWRHPESVIVDCARDVIAPISISSW